MRRHSRILVLAVLAFFGLIDGRAQAASNVAVDAANKTVSFKATVNGAYMKEGSWHLAVYEGGTNNGKSLFNVTKATPEEVHKALEGIGGKPGDNMTSANVGQPNVKVKGTSLDVYVSWDGQSEPLKLQNVLKELKPNKKAMGMDIKFGGNLSDAGKSAGTGCIICMYSCPAGITSNAKMNSYKYTNQDKGAYRYLGNSAKLPKDGTEVTIILKIKK